MHDTSLQIGRLALETYRIRSTPAILELGSLDVNGSLRSFAPEGARYIGVDLVEGPGVDVVTKPGAPLPVEDESFDLVLASSVLEHDPAFWNTFLGMCRKARPGGFVYINVPSNGAVHRYPEDHWRFYPDSGKALASWAVSQGQPVELVESFTARREADIWNDFIAVFRKGPARKRLPWQLLYEQIPGSMNVQIGRALEFLNSSATTEDMDLVAKGKADARRSGEIVAKLEHALAEIKIKLSEYESRVAQLESALCQRQEEME